MGKDMGSFDLLEDMAIGEVNDRPDAIASISRFQKLSGYDVAVRCCKAAIVQLKCQ